MGFVITEAQRQDAMDDGVLELAEIAAILTANKGRVLDLFREMDRNVDGCVSKGEFCFAMESLGLNISQKQAIELFDHLDPSGDGYIEYHEIQRGLINAAKGIAPEERQRKEEVVDPKKLAEQERENRHISNELNEAIYDFERSLELNSPNEPRPPSAQALRAAEQIERLAEEARAQRAATKKVGAPVIRGEMTKMDQVWIKSTVVRPSTAPARAASAAAAARRKEAIYDYWLNKHRAELTAHERAVEQAFAADKRMRKQRVEARREKLLSTMASKRQTSKASAVSREEPFWKAREEKAQRDSQMKHQRMRAWSQEIVFLPPDVAAREERLKHDRSAPDWEQSIKDVQSLPKVKAK